MAPKFESTYRNILMQTKDRVEAIDDGWEGKVT